MLADGDGTYTISDTYIGLSVAVADVNHDGHADLIVGASSNAIAVFTGNGAGGVGAEIDSLPGATPGALAVRDFNGDGRPMSPSCISAVIPRSGQTKPDLVFVGSQLHAINANVTRCRSLSAGAGCCSGCSAPARC